MFNIFRRLINSFGKTEIQEVDIGELQKVAAEVQLRELAFWVCVNMVANAVSKCTFRTYSQGKEIFDKEHYLWNVDANTNQNSSMFLHKLIAKLYSENEALVIETAPRACGLPSLVVADDWERPREYPASPNIYRSVRVGEFTYSKLFFEEEVLHFQLHNQNIKPVIDGLYASYSRMLALAIRKNEFENGNHWKVHVEQVDEGDPNWQANLQKMLTDQVKRFLNSDSAVLPELTGYKYEDLSTGQPQNTRDIRALIDDVFEFTARGFGIPPVLVCGDVANSEDAVSRWLTVGIDPLCDQLEEEITRKRYGFKAWRDNSKLEIDTSSIMHFDLFKNATNIDKLISSGGYSINDVRRAANQPPIGEPWAGEHFITKNYSTLQEVLKQLEGGTS